MRVLYIDDDRINTLLFVETCRMAANTGVVVEVETAGTGAEALELVATWRPHLLVIDLHLPDTNGYALLPNLRRHLGQDPAQLPAVLCSADDAQEVRAQAHTAGFDDCWPKPVDLQHVLAGLARYSLRPRGTPE